MAAANDDNRPDPSQLADTAQDVPLEFGRTVRRPQSNSWFDRLVDRVGPIAPYAGFAIVAIAFAVGTIGGPDFAWVAVFYLVATALFLIYLPYLFRKNRRETDQRVAELMALHQSARAEAARIVLENKEKSNE